MNFFQKVGWLLGCCWLCCLPVLAQLSVVYPHSRLVVQRGTDNTASLFVVGTFSRPVDRIEARLVATQTDFGQTTDWQTITPSPRQGVFQGVLVGRGGWYRLDVRGIRGSDIISQASVERVGIGEVFLVAGQSNAMGIPNRGARNASERVVSVSISNKYLNASDVTVSADQPSPVPVFSTLQATSLIFPTGETSWCWGELGDAIGSRYGVPVAFFNAGFPGTIAYNWSQTAHGQPTTNIFTSLVWPNLQPYANVRNTLQYYHSQFGIRAVLWHHGESDAVPYQTPSADYQRYVQELIDQSRLDFGQNMAWVVARCSITPAGPISSTAIVGAQNRLIQTPGNNVWAGPNTDSIQLPRPADGHFQNIPSGEQGLSEFAQSWVRSLTESFFTSTRPIQPHQFLRTGLLPAQIPLGYAVRVPFSQAGFPTSPNLGIQLLTAAGSFVTELPQIPNGSDFRVRIPDTLRTGMYQLRVVARSPVVAGVSSDLFRVVDASQPLNPILDIQTERDSASTRVYWLSAQEEPGSRFVIERQTDNGLFEPIGNVDALNDGQPHHLYTFTDGQPPALYTYRIRLETPAGLVAFSPNAIITGINEPTTGPSIYPNPNTGNTLSLTLPGAGLWTITFVDQLGRVVGQHTVSAIVTNTVTLPLSSGLPAGSYLIQLRHQNQLYTRRLVIVR